jgi:hypothetical protein
MWPKAHLPIRRGSRHAARERLSKGFMARVRSIKSHPHHLGYAAGVVAVGLIDLSLQYCPHVPRLNTDHLWFPKILSAQIRLMMENQRIIRRDAFDPSSAGNIGR